MNLLIRREPEPSFYAKERRILPFATLLSEENGTTFAGNRTSLKIENVENLSVSFTLFDANLATIGWSGFSRFVWSNPSNIVPFDSVFRLLPNLRNVNLSDLHVSNSLHK